MKRAYPNLGLARICSWFGVTRQAYYQDTWRQIDKSVETQLVLGRIRAIRLDHPRMGGRKLYELLQPFLKIHSIKMGRDALFDLLSTYNLLVKRKKRKTRTTYSHHWLRKYPNRIKDFIPSRSNQLWVSDLTYWNVSSGVLYLSFITDAYSHKIVGYQVALSLHTIGCLKALQMALEQLKDDPQQVQLIHHSDRGVQYCSGEYVKLLQENHIIISMTENGDPLENPIAERINGIIKGEYLETYTVKTIQQAQQLLDQVVTLYNEQRPHLSLGNLTPDWVHRTNQKGDRKWKNYYKTLPVNLS